MNRRNSFSSGSLPDVRIVIYGLFVHRGRALKVMALNANDVTFRFVELIELAARYKPAELHTGEMHLTLPNGYG